MLVLSRKITEQIRIGDGITITVLRIQGNTVRLGIAAPKETRVLRGELEPRLAIEANDGGPESVVGVDPCGLAAPTPGMMSVSSDSPPVSRRVVLESTDWLPTRHERIRLALATLDK